MSDVETLRKAAALMRNRAARATPGPWGSSSKRTTPNTILTRITKQGVTVAEARNHGQGISDLNHLSHWHPAVALAVADWLDVVAETSSPTRAGFDEALAVAREYLGAEL